MRIFCTFIIALLLASSTLANTKELDQKLSDKYSAWLELLKTEALQLGVHQETIDNHLAKVALIPRAIQADKSQPEFKENIQNYVTKRVSEWRINRGRSFLQDNHKLLETISARYGVQARFITAILGIESNYGTYKLPYSALNVLVTLAYDPRRGERFRGEVFATLKMLDEGMVDESQLRSSWAGALGAPQFMPSTYLEFGVDYNEDGRVDIWNIGPDLFASIANYLSHYGWNDTETWARKVILPIGKVEALESLRTNQVELDAGCKKYHEHLVGWKTLKDWNELGVRRMTGMDLPALDIPGAMIVTHAENHHAYLVYRNFCSIMRYNPSFKYALSVGILSDEIE